MTRDSSMRARRLSGIGVAAALAGLSIAALRAAPPPATRTAILEAEDARAATAAQLGLLTTAAVSGPGDLQAMAVRALGRLERPGLVATILPLLDARAPAVRAEAAWALAQSAGADVAAARTAREAMVRRLAGERDHEVRGALAAALGRLPLDSPAAVEQTESALLEVASKTEVSHRLGKQAAGPRIVGLTLIPTRVVAVPEPALVGALRGLEAFARGRARARQPLMPVTVDRLKAIALDDQAPPRARVLAMLCLLPVGAVDRDLAARAMADDDFQVRRLALTSPAADLPTILRGLKDPDWMVRYEALLRYGRRFQAAEGCEQVVSAIGARTDHQSLLAIDLLGGPCRPGDHAVETLLDLAAGVGAGDWHRPAHAIVAAIKAAPERARPMLGRFLSAGDWHTRMYAARAAAEIPDVAALRRLAADANANVREAAVTGLSKVAGHDADDVYVTALGASDFQLVIAAAKALAGSPARPAAGEDARATDTQPVAAGVLAGGTASAHGVLPALFSALSRLTALDSDTSRDPRMAVLERIQELGSPNDAGQLKPYLDDRDARIAGLAADILTKWTGSAVSATPKPRPVQPFTLTDAEFERLSRSAVRITMGNGRQFEVRLLMDLAPVDAARFAALVGQGYYNGLTFHRVIPDALVQGGSPGANEYAGVARYWRDEFGRTSQTRGTVGLSTRGRDTGDGQFYVNLVDTPRYDNEYTIFGEVTSGMDVVDGILEGDVMQRVELVPAKTRK